ncbi:tripartite tricarboxylate transporter TctB family protein [Thioalkalivibrio sp. HK1]|uniref:tripartite tricarboxylate transporter TctB family protein n=1 Tax=Thioalkalivibrio sp. HK1 TaxID=1469245 RepID=UPI000471803D|nr:tripartite tricarboxylate transporter TctB family protein [Thioalkalivibrio sp. HK1]
MKARLTGVGIAAIGLTLFFLLIPLGIDTPGRVDHITLAPDFWPRIVSLILAAMGLWLILFPGPDDRGTDNRGPDNPKTNDPVSAPSIGFERRARLAAVLALLFGYYLAIDWLGMVLPGTILIASLSFLAGERRPLPLILPALCLPALLYAFFVHIAGVPIPLGIFEFLRG